MALPAIVFRLKYFGEQITWVFREHSVSARIFAGPWIWRIFVYLLILGRGSADMVAVRKFKNF